MKRKPIPIVNFVLRQIMVLLFPIVLYFQLLNNVTFSSWEGFGLLGGMVILLVISKIISRISLRGIIEPDPKENYQGFYVIGVLILISSIVSRDLIFMLLVLYLMFFTDSNSDDPKFKFKFIISPKTLEKNSIGFYFFRVITIVSLYFLSFFAGDWILQRILGMFLIMVLYFVNMIKNIALTDFTIWKLGILGFLTLNYLGNLLLFTFFESITNSIPLVNGHVVAKTWVLLNLVLIDLFTLKIDFPLDKNSSPIET